MTAMATCPWCSADPVDGATCHVCGAVLGGGVDEVAIPGLTVPDLTEVARSRTRTRRARSAGRVLEWVAFFVRIEDLLSRH